MADFELSSLVTESHRYRDNCPQHLLASLVNEWQVRSLSSLLATPDAAELVMSFLASDNNCNLLWLSNSFCISMNDLLHEVSSRIRDFVNGSIMHFIRFTFRVSTNWRDNSIYLYGPRSPELSSLVPVVDALFQLLTWHKTLSKVELICSASRNLVPLPVSVPALETFVGQAKSQRIVELDATLSLSAEQCRVLAFGCNENIKLIVRASQSRELLALLTEALTLNQSPKRLRVRQLASLPDDLFHAFHAAVESNMSLLELDFHGLEDLCTLKSVALFRAIGRNKGLQCLGLEYVRLPDAEWKFLWEESLSRHPTIKTLNIKGTTPLGSDRQRRDEVMGRSLRTNSVLTKIKYNEFEHSPHTMGAEVLPILEFNRFRPLVEAIKQEEDQALRCHLFTMTLLHDQVRSRPPFRYLLLIENPDLLLQCIRTRQVEQLDAVVGSTDDCGISLPSSVAESALIIRKRKR